MTQLFDEVESAHGRIDIYLHVAGITLPSQGGFQNVDTFAATLDANLIGAYRCCADVGQRMARQRRGSIVTVTSIGSLLAFPNNPGYVAAKGGLRMMSKALALDLGPHNVRVNNLVPGYIHTDMTAGSFASPTLHAERAGRTMLGRWGQVDDLLGAAIFLASPASSYVTGTDLVVDGGWTAKGL
jgi:NAD(P)-dependent dehydrogenase (short-subunit alcohol dehydrogenase family)